MKPDANTIAVDQDGTIHALTTAESDGSTAGPIVELTAKGHAEQATTTGKNLCDVGTASFTGRKQFPLPMPSLGAGTYTISAEVTSSDTDADTCLVLPHYTDDTYPLGEQWVKLTRGSRASGTIVAEKEFDRIRFYASDNDSNSNNDTATWANIQLELGSTATEYEPYTGGAPSPSPDYPQEIQVVSGHEVTGKTGRYVDLEAQGKNLLDESAFEKGTINQNTGVFQPNPIFNIIVTDFIACDGGATYCVSGINAYRVFFYTGSRQYIENVLHNLSDGPFTAMSNARYIRLQASETVISSPQLEVGSTATDYEPYYHSTTPIPLPSRGWAAGLPDGTADVLTLDGAGKVTWERKTEMLDLSDITWALDTLNDVPNMFMSSMQPQALLQSSLLCTHYKGVQKNTVSILDGEIAATGTQSYMFFRLIDSRYSDAESFNVAVQGELLYKLVTPVTEDMGYIDLPDIPEGASISIPELDALNVHYIVDDAAAELARMWYERAYAELGDAIVELAGRVATLENA